MSCFQSVRFCPSLKKSEGQINLGEPAGYAVHPAHRGDGAAVPPAPTAAQARQLTETAPPKHRKNVVMTGAYGRYFSRVVRQLLSIHF